MKTRIYFLDHLRTFLIFLVVLLHAGLVYESALENNWLVVDPAKNNALGLVRMYLDLFVMFTLFFISGYFIPNSIKNKNAWDFLKSKFNRIYLPWIIAVFTLIPVYKVIFLYSRGLPQEAWHTYFHLYERTGSDLSFFANDPSQSWLWFLPILFLFQVVYLILWKTKLLSVKVSLKMGVVIVFILGIIFSMIVSSLGLTGWTLSSLFDFQRERFLVYFMFFLLGSLCYKHQLFETKKKNKKLYIFANVVLTLALTIFTLVALNLFYNIIDVNRNYYFISESVDKLGYYVFGLLSTLSFLYIMIHIFRFNFNKNYTIMEHLNKNSYQVYIIHMIVLGLIALPLVNVPIPVFIKYLVLTVLTFGVSNLIVYAYRSIFRKPFAINLRPAIILLAGLLTISVYTKQAGSTIPNEANKVMQTTPSGTIIGLHEAVILGDLEAVIQHIENGSDLNVRDPLGGSSPLITAAVFDKAEIAIVLIEAGADINFTNNDGATPLHSAAFFCNTKIVRILLDYGADVTIKNNGGSTALETIMVPFDTVKGIYDYFSKALSPLGLKLDYKLIQETRPQIATLLSQI